MITTDGSAFWVEADPFPEQPIVDPCSLPAGTAINTRLRESVVMPSLDIETYSEAGYVLDVDSRKVRGLGPQGKGGLGVVGTPVYFEHPSAEILSMYYDLKDGRGRRHWRPGAPTPTDLVDHVAGGGHLEAWNMAFEWWGWNMIFVRRYGWPELPLEQCHCAMAKSRRFSLPGKLDLAATVLGVPNKDKEGARLIQKFTRPHPPTKNRDTWRHPPQGPDFEMFVAYNEQDVVVEDHCSAHIPDLTPWERTWWLADQRINARGLQVDVPALEACLRLLEEAEAYYNGRLAELTNGVVVAVTKRDEMLAWLQHQGVFLSDLRKGTVADALASDAVQGAAREVLDIRSKLGSANVKKLRTLALQTNSDGRLRNQYVFCGADRTGRASAGGVQLQNMTAKGPKIARCEDPACGRIFSREVSEIGCPRCNSWMVQELPEWSIEGVCQALEDIQTMNLYQILTIWGDPIKLLCGCLRGLFTAREGSRLICCDYSAIEAVVLACLARCQWRINVFSTTGKIYEESAARATNTPVDEIIHYKRVHGTHHPARSTIGKVRELAGGYGGWVNAWKQFGADEFMDDQQIKQDVLKWREESPEIVELWGGQFRGEPWNDNVQAELFGLEGAFIKARLNPNAWHGYIDIGYWYDDTRDVMLCRLPSGRFLHYHRPRLIEGEDKLRRGPCWRITFEGYNSNPTKGRIGWIVQETYGGRLAENVTQAVAADFQFAAMVRVEEHGYPVVLHTHDELCAEVPEGQGSVAEMEALMAQRPSWADWWPIRAAGWEHKRYQKD